MRRRQLVAAPILALSVGAGVNTNPPSCWDEVALRLRKVVAVHLNVPIEKTIETARFKEDLGADSLDEIELILACEEEFGIEIPDDAAIKLFTLHDAIKFVVEEAERYRPGICS